MSLATVPAGVSRAAGSRPGDPAAPHAGAWPWLLGAVSLVLAVNVISGRYLYADSFYDLYAGRYIVHDGIPHQNVATLVSHGAPWVDQQWLAQVVYYAAWAAGGYRALAALSAVLVTSGFAMLALLMLRRGVPATRAFAWTLAAVIVCLGNIVIRAQSFAYPLIALTLWLILEDDRAPRPRARTWLVVPLLVLWANTHGSALLGAGLVAGYAGYRMAKALAQRNRGAVPAYAALGTMAAATFFCTPYGTGVIRYYTSLIGNPALSHNVLEWAPPNPLYAVSWGFFALLLVTLAAVVVAWRRGTRPDPLVCALAVMLLALALTAIRNQAWFGFGGSLLAADTLARSNGGRVAVLGKTFCRVLAGALAALAVLSLGALGMTPASKFESLIPRRAIDVAAALARKNPAVHVLGDDWCGSPMLWLHPAMFGRVAFDARFEQYSQSEFTAFAEFVRAQGPGWQRVMRGYDLVVVSRDERPKLAAALPRLPGWRVVYADRHGLVLERRDRT
jgi:hypothetical protein